jgi:class 3 adenylate cyclase
MAAPLRNPDGVVIGVMRSARSDPQDVFTQADLELLVCFANQVSYLIGVIREHRSLLYKEVIGVVSPHLPIADFERLISRFSTPTPKTVTMMYVDLRGFTRFAGSVLMNDADQIIQTLNCFFGAAVPAVMDYGGTIDKFQGDGFIALFNAYKDCPNHALQALHCAHHLRTHCWENFRLGFFRLMDERYDRFLEDDDFTLGLKIGIGVADVVVGPVGVWNDQYQRQDFTFIGQDANLISRLISDVPNELEENASAKGITPERLNHLTLFTGRTNRLVAQLVVAEPHQVLIRGAGSARGRSGERQRVYELREVLIG